MASVTSPKISVLMPVYNAGPYLREAVDSILNQTFSNFEFVAVNDGSIDDTLSILQEYERRDDRMCIISRPNTGIVGALNDGLRACRGELIARMDGDDVAMANRFERQVAFMDERQDVVALGCMCLVVDEKNNPFNIWGRLTDHEEIESKWLLGKVSALHHSAAMFRKQAMLQVGGYRNDVGVSEDLDLYLRLAECGRVANLPEMLMTVRRHPESTSERQSAEQLAWSRKKIINDAMERRGMKTIDAIEMPIAADSQAQVFHRRSMQAYKNGFVRSARKYACRVLLREPFRRRSWALLRTVYSRKRFQM